MSEPTTEDRVRWATYAVNAGYAKWSENVPGRTVENKEAYFTLFGILEAEHKRHAVEPGLSDRVIKRCRETLAENGYCGDGDLISMLQRALDEAKKKGAQGSEDLVRALQNNLAGCWRHLGDETGELDEAIGRALERERAVMAALQKHLDSGRGVNLWPATKGFVVEVEGLDGDVVGEDLHETILKALAELEDLDVGDGPRTTKSGG